MGTAHYEPETVTVKGELAQAKSVIDTETGEALHTKDIDNKLKSSKPYKQWLRDNARHIASYDTTVTVPIEGEALNIYQKMFQVTLEERDQVLKPLAQSGNEAVGLWVTIPWLSCPRVSDRSMTTSAEVRAGNKSTNRSSPGSDCNVTRS